MTRMSFALLDQSQCGKKPYGRSGEVDRMEGEKILAQEHGTFVILVIEEQFVWAYQEGFVFETGRIIRQSPVKIDLSIPISGVRFLSIGP